ncbi:MAG: diguanylate cyclase [Roseateles sp.]|uniref:diguanylate cyclase n=1 Tax=Roseateles sp. TaxID=1971397 RepID=UPI00403502B6
MNAVNTPPPARILVVDDVEDALASTQALLERPGVIVLTASCADQALALLEQHEVALALLDVEMPLVSGFTLAARMRGNASTRNTPIIFLTGNTDGPSRTFRGYEAGAVDFLIKPVAPHVLESKVGVFVELYHQRRELHARNAELEQLLSRNEALAEELRLAHGKAVHEALTDALTRVPNRRHILQLGAAMLADRRRQWQPVSLALLDLDHFKGINDMHGHAAGDAVLRAFCVHVGARMRTSHMLGRLGGEEFLLLMPGTSIEEAEVVIERVRCTLQPYAGVAYKFSAGLVQAASGEALEAAIERADDALYEAKRNGRDRSVTRPAPL